MSGSHHSTNPMAIARDMGQVAKETGSPAMEKASKWLLITTAAVSAIAAFGHFMKSIYRDATKHNGNSGHHYSPPQSVREKPAHTPDTPPNHAKAEGQETNWVKRSKHEEEHERHPRVAHHHGYGGRHV